MKDLKLGVAITAIIIAVILLPWFVFPILNDIKASALRQELQKCPLPQNTKVVDAISGSGNTGGTGNHTEIWAAILIKTELSENEIEKFYGEDIFKVDASKKRTFVMKLLNKDFSTLSRDSNLEGCYVVERIGDAVSSFFDIRGH